jgi:pSer/pThr/pTyr-binding forkhead associated (FHA) protein
MQVVLDVVAGPIAGRKIVLQDGQGIVVGRTERASFPVPQDTFLSGVHFAVECRGSTWCVVDQKSRNGTFVNGSRVTQAAIRDGDEILAGQTKFAVRLIQPTQASVAPTPGPAPVPTPKTSAPSVRVTAGLGLVVGSWAFYHIPEGWRVIEGNGIRLTGQGCYPTEAVVTEDRLELGATFKQYIESQFALLRMLVSSPQISALVPATVNGADEAMTALVRYTTPDGCQIVQQQVFARKREVAGVATLTTPSDQFVLMRPVFERIVAGLVFGAGH